MVENKRDFKISVERKNLMVNNSLIAWRQTMIQMYDVSKSYDNGLVALSEINVKINKGDFVFLVGPSGAGKSTFIKLIYREEKPSRGQIIVNGRNLVRMHSKEIPYLRRNIGVIFQDFRLLPNKTVFENVAFALEVIETPTRDIKRRVMNVLEAVGLADKAKAMPLQLSGGEQQRVSIARAIVNNPQLVIADEPTGNLDPDSSLGIMEIFNSINKRGATVVIATHAKEIVDRYQRRVIAIENGRIVRDQLKGVYGYEI